jgi:hypothetical protein
LFDGDGWSVHVAAAEAGSAPNGAVAVRVRAEHVTA